MKDLNRPSSTYNPLEEEFKAVHNLAKKVRCNNLRVIFIIQKIL